MTAMACAVADAGNVSGMAGFPLPPILFPFPHPYGSVWEMGKRPEIPAVFPCGKRWEIRGNNHSRLSCSSLVVVFKRTFLDFTAFSTAR